MSGCDCYDYDPPSVYRQQARRARKPHKCCDCGAEIKPGDEYLSIFGVWEGEAESFCMCLLCEDMRTQCEFACVPLGRMVNDIYSRPDDQTMEVVAFKRRYEASE
jgi:hypothetical protein